MSTLTVTGNEITDALRVVQGPVDGYPVPWGKTTSPYRAAVLGANPKLYWRLGDSPGVAHVADESGHGLTGTPGAGITFGKAGLILGDASTSALFDNTNNAKILSDLYRPFTSGSKRTFMGVAVRGGTIDDDVLFSGSGANDIPLLFVSGGNVVFQTTTGSTATWAGVWPNTGIVYHWALTYDDSAKSAELFINGVSQGVKALGASYTAGGIASFYAVGGPAGSPWNGWQAEVSVFEGILNATQIKAIYSAMFKIPQGGVGVWPAHTNTAPNTTFASVTTGWVGFASTVLSVDSTQTDLPFPSHNALKNVCTAAGAGCNLTAAYRPAAATGQTWVFSCWIKGTAGSSVFVEIGGRTSGGAASESFSSTVTLTGSWQRVSITCTLANATTASLTPEIQVNAPTSQTFWMAAPMLAKSPDNGTPYDFPYIANATTTIGVTATRSAGRVQAPASLLNSTQGWIAMLIEPSYPAQPVAQALYGFAWESDASDFLGLRASVGGAGPFDAIDDNATVQTPARQSLAYSAWQPIVLVMAWDATNIYISVNGAPFTSATPANRVLPNGANFDIGSLAGAQQLGGNVLWAAAGTGTLSSVDLAELATYTGAQQPPTLVGLENELPTGAVTMVWNGISSIYDGVVGITSPARIADWRLQIGWQGLVDGKLHFSTTDPFFATTPGDVWANLWTENFTGAYNDVTDDLAEGSQVTWSRGSDRQIDAQIQAGEVTFKLCNAQQPNLYDPNDPNSPLYGLFVPMRPVRLIASLDGWRTQSSCFYAFITEADYDPDTYTCTVTCQDLVAWLGRIYPVISAQTGISSSTAIALVLASIGFTDPNYLALETVPAITNINFAATGAKTALQLITDILSVERGTFWVDGGGVFHFEGRYARDGKLTASYDLETPLIGWSSKMSIDLIGNRALVTDTGTGNQQIATDTASIQVYGANDIANISSAYLPDDPHARDLAALLVQRAKDAHPPLNAVADNDSLATIQAQLGLDVNQRVTIYGTDCFVERIDQQLDAGGQKLTTTLTVTEAPSTRALLFGTNPAFSSAYFG